MDSKVIYGTLTKCLTLCLGLGLQQIKNTQL